MGTCGIHPLSPSLSSNEKWIQGEVGESASFALYRTQLISMLRCACGCGSQKYTEPPSNFCSRQFHI
eukprot:1182200-Prorocentrum_minimum.AAC.3